MNDTRSLSAEALESLRRRAVAAVESGVSRAEVARTFGVSRKAVGIWVHAYRERGEAAFRPKLRGRRPREQAVLSSAQESWTIKTILAGTPDNHGLPHQLWTFHAIAELVDREFGILLSSATVALYLVRWGLIDDVQPLSSMRGRTTTTIPDQRSAESTAMPWIPGAGVVWAAWTQPHAPFGDVNVLLATSSDGALFFQARQGPFDADHASDFLARLTAQLGRSLNVVVCQWPLPHYAVLLAWPGRHADKISIRFVLDSVDRAT